MKIDSFCIKMLIAKRGMNLSEFERRSGIAKNTLSPVLKRGSCSLAMVGRIAKGLRVSPEKIVDDSEKEKGGIKL